MRARLWLVLIALAVLPVALAFLLGREGHSGARSPSQTPTQISLELKRPGGNTPMIGCGLTHHFALYPAGTTIAFQGSVADPPSGSWHVKVKLKACIAGAFVSAGDTPVSPRSDGRFKGSFPAPVPGLYFARASVDSGGRAITDSYKRFFVIR